MTEERIIDALTDIDEKYIIEANKLRSKKRHVFPIRKVSLIAACAALVFLCAFLVPILQRKTEGSVVNPPAKEESLMGADSEKETEAESKYTDAATDAPEATPDIPEDDESTSMSPETENESIISTPSSGEGISGSIGISSPDGDDFNEEAQGSAVLTVTVSEFTEDGFICSVSSAVPGNETVSTLINVICTLDISDLSEGCTVTLYYLPHESDPYTVYATHIEIEKGE